MKAERRLQNYLIRGSHSFTVLSIAAPPSLSLSFSDAPLVLFLTVYFQYPPPLFLSFSHSLFFSKRSVGLFYKIFRVGFDVFLLFCLTVSLSDIKAFAFPIAPPTLLLSRRGFHGNHSTGWPVDALILHGAIGSVCMYHQMHRLVGFIYQGFYNETNLFSIILLKTCLCKLGDT